MSTRIADGLAFEVSGSGPPLLLVHAGIADRSMWEPQWQSYREWFTVIRYDQRGFGDSEDPRVPYSLHEDALRVLDAAGAERAQLIGCSMGGGACLDLALAAPDRIAGLITIGATPSGWSHGDAMREAFDVVEARYEHGGLTAANEEELKIWVDGQDRTAAEVDQQARARIGRMNLRALEREEAREQAENEIEPLELEPTALARLESLEPPTLVLAGAHDQPSILAGSALIAAAAGSELVELAGAAHLPSLEQPAAFDGVVLPFLRGHAD